MARCKLLKHNDKCQMGGIGLPSFDDTKKHLTVGETYSCSARQYDWYTVLVIDGKRFNSVCFEVTL